MEQILFINACVRGKEVSRTYFLASQFLKTLKERSADVTVTELDLNSFPLPPLNRDLLARRDRLVSLKQFDAPLFDLAHQFAAADKIIIAAPFWDLSFPALLKVYLEHICVCGVTFAYGEQGSYGLCKAEKLLFITTRGGIFSDPDMDFMEVGSKYLRALSSMLGIGEFACLSAEGLDIWELDSAGLLERAVKEGQELAKTF